MRSSTRERHRKDLERKELAERKCWRCGQVVGMTSGEAILVVAWADDSYSGIFHVPLCDVCLTDPHQSDMHSIMGGHITDPGKWVFDRLREDKKERAK